MLWLWCWEFFVIEDFHGFWWISMGSGVSVVCKIVFDEKRLM